MSKNDTRKLDVHSWNPFTGCTKVSPACKNCYAERMAYKLNKWGTSGYENGFRFTVHHQRLEKSLPLKRKKPTIFFINNMSDTFHEDAGYQSIDAIIDIIQKAHWHNFYILTKRSERMKRYFSGKVVPDNLWLGVTVEDQKHGIPRLQDLREIECSHKHICCEPLLEDLGNIDLSEICMVVGGGESGDDSSRKTDVNWVESLQFQCQKQGVHFYWKQWGAYGPDGVYKGKGKTGYLINGKACLSFPDNLIPPLDTLKLW